MSWNRLQRYEKKHKANQWKSKNSKIFINKVLEHNTNTFSLCWKMPLVESTGWRGLEALHIKISPHTPSQKEKPTTNQAVGSFITDLSSFHPKHPWFAFWWWFQTHPTWYWSKDLPQRYQLHRPKPMLCKSIHLMLWCWSISMQQRQSQWHLLPLLLLCYTESNP